MKNLLLVFALAAPLLAQMLGPNDVRVSVVAGESWLNHLHRTFDETSMGKTGLLGPAPGEETTAWQLGLSPGFDTQTVILHGSDIYRLDCRGCHGESGLGAPPEINSVINPVRAGSTAVILARMKKLGMEISRANAAELAKQSTAALLQRVLNGGEDMPPFRHLSEPEVHALVAYLKLLAGVPGAEREQLAVQEPPVRVGEHIVKSTCHICHSAAGPNPNSRQLFEGAIPPLSTLTTRMSRAEFIRKVSHGVPVVMGMPPLPRRGRMPVFYYLSQDEAADVYQYLTLYPPYTWAILDAATPMSQPAQPAAELASYLPDDTPTKAMQQNKVADINMEAFLLIPGLLVTLLMAGGFGFTVHEFRKDARRKEKAAASGTN